MKFAHKHVQRPDLLLSLASQHQTRRLRKLTQSRRSLRDLFSNLFHTYEEIKTTEDDDDNKIRSSKEDFGQPHPSLTSGRVKNCLTIGHVTSFISGSVLVIIVCAIAFPFLLAQKRDRSTRTQLQQVPTHNHCGSTPVEARSYNCHFDVLLGSWLPAACHDADLMEEYIADAVWKWYEDPGFTRLIPMETMRLGEYEGKVWTNSSEHSDHCAYIWMKQFRAVVDHRPMDDICARYGHTHHCVSKVKNPMGEQETVYGVIRYGKCVALF